MKKLIIITFLISILCGCATTNPDITNAKTLIATKETIINIHESFRGPCKIGTVPADVCKRVDYLTNESMPIYDSTVDASLLYLKSKNANDLASYQAKNEQFLKLLGDITALSLKYSTSKEGANK